MNQNSRTVIVSDVLCKHLCLYAWERKTKNMVLFQQVCIFVMYVYIGGSVKLIQGENLAPVYATLV